MEEQRLVPVWVKVPASVREAAERWLMAEAKE